MILVVKEIRPMNLLNLTEVYPDESSCKAAFKAYRDAAGIVYPKCGCREHYWLQGKEEYACKKCHTRQGLRSHTVSHASHLPYRYRFIAIWAQALPAGVVDVAQAARCDGRAGCAVQVERYGGIG